MSRSMVRRRRARTVFDFVDLALGPLGIDSLM